MVRGPATTSYNPNSNTVDIEEKNGLFEDDNGTQADFRQSALITHGPAFTEGSDILGNGGQRKQRRPRPASHMRALHTQADMLLTQSEMQIYDKFRGGKEVITPRGFGAVENGLSQSVR